MEALPLPVLPPMQPDNSPFSQFIAQSKPSEDELLMLLIGLAPQVFPNFFDAILARYLPPSGELPEFGGAKSGNHKGLLPTGDTAIFILAGSEPAGRLNIQRLLRYSPF